MSKESPPQNEVQELRNLIQGFISERLKPKLEEVDKKITKAEQGGSPAELDELREKREQLLEEYVPGRWLASAAKRAAQLQVVTHALKYSHPDARGSGIAVAASRQQLPDDLVGTPDATSLFHLDVVGNAAALDVFKFLKLEYDGRTLLSRIIERDPSLSKAFSNDPAEAEHLMDGFAAVMGAGKSPTSHTLAKQIYFPLDDGSYHLLAPLFPTACVHGVRRRVKHDRFEEEMKEARKARREGKGFPHGYRDYPDLAVQAFGGTKPQNISQLNSERGGEHWLLAALPPKWKRGKLKPPQRIDSIFGAWLSRRPYLREVLGILGSFLSSVGEYSNAKIKSKRKRLVEQVIDEVFQAAAELMNLPPGWSAESECRLHAGERLWLDPGRAETDEAFAEERRRGDWQDVVASRFARWFNHQLRYFSNDKLSVGDEEHQEWKVEFLKVLKEFEEVPHG